MNQISNSSRIEDLFEAVIALPPGERGGYLRAQCGDDSALLEELQRLVRGHETAGDDFLRPPPPDPRWQALFRREDRPDPLIGTRIGRYTIKSVIGVGGMGTVYLAEQESPRREVALKVMTAGVLTTRSALHRFEYESQILAKLRHPNIAHVYEAGTADVTVAADPRVGRREGEGARTGEMPVPHREGEAPAEPLNVAQPPSAVDGNVAQPPSAVSPATGKIPVPHREGEAPAEPLNVAQPPSAVDGNVAQPPSAVSPATGKIPVPHQEGEAPAEPSRTVRVAYFAMEYIPGAKSITRHAAENGLAVRERLALFLQVCDAVQYGHTKGVIHRDLKPGNILVGEESVAADPRVGRREPVASDSRVGRREMGEDADIPRRPLGGDATQSEIRNPQSEIVKVIDFGVAKSTDSDVALTTARTDVGQIIGTLQYMSPEQAGGTDCGTGVSPVNRGTGSSPAGSADIDTRSDVYSLGVVLYELLTERLPYDVSNMTLHSAMRRICEQAPTKPSALRNCGTGVPPVNCGTGVSPVAGKCGTGVSPVKGDLETIILKALEKDREKRYQSAADLAADIRRHLAGEPISARPPTRWTRTMRLVARHPVATTAALCMGIVLLAGLATWGTVWLLRQRPHHIEVSKDAKEAWLMSFAGRELKQWGADRIDAAGIAELPGEHGTRRLGIIGFINGRDVPFPNSLCAYDVDRDLNRPLWERHVETEELPPRLVTERKFKGVQYHAADCRLMDIFPEEPGDEIVMTFGHEMYAHPCIRIYSLDGRLLYQIWHDGSLTNLPCYWMEEARLLVFAGCNSEAFWSERGYPVRDRKQQPYPIVVFAIRPVKGAIRSEYVYQSAQGRSEDAAWYKCLIPVEDVYELASCLSLEAPTPGPDRGRTVRVYWNVRIEGAQSSVSWMFDDSGRVVDGSRVVHDSYWRELDKPGPKPPHPDKLHFADLPPIVKRIESSTNPHPTTQTEPASRDD